MSKITARIINHTHWDREWFLSSIYTTHWIPGLIDSLEKLGAANPDFRYFFDGQTLVIEDLLAAYPEYEEKIAQLIAAGTLTIGPYYCQPDWKLTCGESLIRNLQYGQRDGARFRATAVTGWLVDTFGHISQAPQIHQQAGIEAVYVWRGVPRLEPYFTWQGADGSPLFAVDLFGGYRNLYGVTRVPEVAATRLQSEVDKLSPFYPTADIPLFDGYDLEDNPEDPVQFFRNQYSVIGNQCEVREATPRSFVEEVRSKLGELPTIVGELNSGKYGATFTGVYSTRTYTKVLNRDCTYQLYQVAEPLAVLAWLKGRPYEAIQYEQWSRLLLQNGVHDVICGVSIDQVHEKAVDIYRRVFEGTLTDIENSLKVIMQDFASGTYAISTNPFAQDLIMHIGEQALWAKTDGIGVWPVTPLAMPKSTTTYPQAFSYSNNYYAVEINKDGTVQLANGRLGSLIVYAEHGDTYSDETGDQIAVLQPSSLLKYENRDYEMVVHYDCQFEHEGLVVETAVRIILDGDPLIRWQIDLDSQGTDFRVELIFDTGITGQVLAGMPFDVVQRPFADTDLLSRDVGDDLAKIFMGQRELNEVRSFPFHDFVAIEGEGETASGKTAAVFAKGINSYRAYEDGRLAITLRRSMEWVTKGNLANRIGDAGPFFYVPDAHCERLVRHELAFTAGDFAADSMELQRLNASYQNPPLIVQWDGEGTETNWPVLQADMPLSSLQIVDEEIVARWFNPTQVDGQANEEVIEAKKVRATAVALPKSISLPANTSSQVSILNQPTWRIGSNQGLPDPQVIAQLREQIADSEAALHEAQNERDRATGHYRYRWQHRVYIHHREMLEYTLSARLNEIKLAMNGQINDSYLYETDDEVSQIGWELNQSRIKRRIYDYVVAALPASS